MDWASVVFDWAWARHHNPLSWYIRPFFLLPFCYFAYRKNIWGLALTTVAMLSSMFWFAEPTTTNPRAAAFLAMEQQYVAGPWTPVKLLLIGLIPLWFIAMAWAFWRRSWLTGLLVIAAGTLLKIIWSFYYGGQSAWAIGPPVAVWLAVCATMILYWHRRFYRVAHSAPG